LSGIRWTWLCWIAVLCACAHAPTPPREGLWQGRISLTVHQEPLQSLSAEFELEGDATQGELTLFSPLGQVGLSLRWSPAGAQWQQNGQTRSFANFADMTQTAMGTDIPLAALFEWLAGRDLPVAGWQMERSATAGAWSARRTHPQPAVTLKIAARP
jgi:outer membrane lipoprotein LolB